MCDSIGEWVASTRLPEQVREVDFAGHDFAEELGHCQVGEEVGADFLERDDDGGVVLRHEEEQGVHGSPQIMPMAFI